MDQIAIKNTRLTRLIKHFLCLRYAIYLKFLFYLTACLNHVAVWSNDARIFSLGYKPTSCRSPYSLFFLFKICGKFHAANSKSVDQYSSSNATTCTTFLLFFVFVLCLCGFSGSKDGLDQGIKFGFR
jgi:hypothetical protein